MDNQEFDSTNINTLWLKNIYENLKNLEEMERLAREGCSNILDYIGIPQEQRGFIIADVQYKNLRFMVTEMNLLLTDLTPVLKEEQVKVFRDQLDNLEKVIHNRSLFVHEPVNKSKRVMISNARPFFWETLSFLTKLRVRIIREMAGLLYMDKKDTKNEAVPRLR